MKNEEHGLTYHNVSYVQPLHIQQTCLDRMSQGHMYIEKIFQRSRSAVWPQLEWKATPVSAWGPLPLFFCPAGRAEPLNSPTHPASTSQIQASSAQPCVAIPGNLFRMLPVLCIHSSLILYFFFFFSICRPLPVFLPTICRLTCLHFVTLGKPLIMYNFDTKYIPIYKVQL